MPKVGQVRLRHRGEPVLSYHMVTHQPIRWEGRSGFPYAEQAHFIFNPSMTRARDVDRFYPCASEREAQRRFLSAGLATVQLSPGVFRHTGANHSLRQKLNQNPIMGDRENELPVRGGWNREPASKHRSKR